LPGLVCYALARYPATRALAPPPLAEEGREANGLS
jgi:hypothetical protein